MKLRLNLATDPIENNRPFVVGLIALGVVCLIALAVLSHSVQRSWRANRELRANISNLQGQIRASERNQNALASYFNTPAAKQVLDRSEFLNSMIEERSFPWTKLFMDLEQTLPPGVHVVSISPERHGDRISVKLTMGAVNDDSKVKFLEALEKSKQFSDVEVRQEKHVQNTSGNPGKDQDHVMLELVAWYETA